MKGQKREGYKWEKWEVLRVGREKGRRRREQSGKGKERTNERERGTIGKRENRGNENEGNERKGKIGQGS